MLCLRILEISKILQIDVFSKFRMSAQVMLARVVAKNAAKALLMTAGG